MLSALLLGAIAGCGKSHRPEGIVNGIVSFDSQPVAEGHVVFENRSMGWLRVAELDSEGRYQIANVPFGEYTVTIQPLEPKRLDETTGSPAEIRAQMATAKAPDPKNIPRPYRAFETSPLKRSVKAGNNEFNFELTEKSK